MSRVGRPSFRPKISNGRWNAKVKTNSRKEWYGDTWEQTSRYVRQRDGYCCQANKLDPRLRCNAAFPPPFHGLLHVHHIVPLPRGSNNPTNLISLCRVCHGKVHGRNLGTITEKQKRAARRFER